MKTLQNKYPKWYEDIYINDAINFGCFDRDKDYAKHILYTAFAAAFVFSISKHMELHSEVYGLIQRGCYIDFDKLAKKHKINIEFPIGHKRVKMGIFKR
jgi:hypothetical protein